MNHTVKHGQSLIDVCLQRTGSLDLLFAIATENQLSITDDLPPGSIVSVTLPDPLPEVAQQLKKKKIIIAASIDPADSPEGIGYWTIGDDFIVS